jgi:NADH-quinone oxidoreductase subunit L
VLWVWTALGTLDYGEVFAAVDTLSPTAATGIALLLFMGACGKSAQLPLHVWLPDAMEGPTPVSALIHAATMVTAGVYMVCRSHVLFERSGVALEVVAWVGVLTAVFAATIGLVQTDIKRVLAYSTVSQLGYMFAAAGLGAYAAAVFHLVTHAFFKALLFLGAGSVIHGLGGEQDLRRMGGLAPRMIATTITMLVGTAALAGIPPFAGFFSKDEILATAFHQKLVIWPLLLFGAFLTAFYSFRLFFLAFVGGPRMSKEAAHHIHESPAVMTWPLIILALLTVGAGVAVGIPAEGGSPFQKFLSPVFGTHHVPHGGVLALILIVLAVVVSVAGLALAAFMYWSSSERAAHIGRADSPWLRLLLHAYYVDALYDRLFVRPYFALSEFLARVFDVRGIDGLVHLVARTTVAGAGWLRRLQTGYTVSYGLTMLVGAVLLLGYLLARP